MKVEFVDLKRQLYGDSPNWHGIFKEIFESISSCVEKTDFTLGKDLETFEKSFADYCGAKYCIGLNSGTDALEFALRCNNIKEGNVITVPNSYFTTASSITLSGAVPRFVDVDRETSNIDASKLECLIDENTKAIIPVHMYGRPCNMDEVIKIANKYDLLVIEDCCHAHGSLYKNKRVPISGIGAFSFFPGKNLGAWGDGGALVTNDENVAENAKLWRNDGSIEKYNHKTIGRKARLHSLQAAILSVKLRYLDFWNNQRRKNAFRYNQNLKDIEEIQLPLLGSKEVVPVFHLYATFTNKRDELKKYLFKNDISTGVHYPIPIHLQQAYKFLGLKEGSFAISEELAKKELSLPMFPELRNDEIDYVCEKIRNFFFKEKRE